MARQFWVADWLLQTRLGKVLFALLCGAMAIACGAGSSAWGADQVRQPNIVFILADDLGINDLSCYGRRDQPTPRADRLAEQGVRFTNAYAALSICSASRAALMTGKSPARLHLTTYLPGRPDSPAQLLKQAEIQQSLPLAEVTLAEHLRAVGYATACIGKWHLGNEGYLPTDQGFDVYHPGKANTTPSATEGGKGEYDITQAAEQFIVAHQQRPFFLYVGHNCPHVPLAAKPELIEKHAGAFHPTYAAMIDTLDDCVGRLADKIDSLGLAQQTIFVFTSDNGGLHVLEGAPAPATYNAPYRAGKGYCYEGGLRIPLIVRWPGKIAPKVSHTPVVNTDWLPTLLTLANVAVPPGLDGRSMDGLLLRNESPDSRPLYWHFPHYTNQGSRPAGAIREGRWKLIEHYEDGSCELFDLEADESETSDLAEKHPARVAELRGKLEAWRRASDATENRANDEFNGAYADRLYRHGEIDTTRIAAAPLAKEMTPLMAPWRKRMDEAIQRSRNAQSDSISPGAGAIILAGRDAQVHGEKLRYEPEAHKDTLGYWVRAEDWAEWEFQVPHAGRFEVELLQACGAGSGGATVEIALGDQRLTATVIETGHFQRFVPRSIGVVTLPAGKQTLAVRALKKPGPAVMDLRRVTLRAAVDP